MFTHGNIRQGGYRALDIAKYVVDRCTTMEHPVSDLQLQKILYYIQLAFIKNAKCLAFNDDIEAWPYGPVVREVYNYFNGFGSNEICLYFSECRSLFQIHDHEQLVNIMIERCLQYRPWELVEMSHNVDGPWYKIYNKRGKYSAIPIEEIIEYALA